MKTLTAETYYKMLCSGANLLAANCETINNMNVFPVPDGDTGSNMTMTMSGVYHFQFDPAMSLGTCASGVAENMLRCARGNSGVILSVFFRGVARTLKEKETATIADFAQAMDAGVKGAYQAVMNPTEGTILSVMRRLPSVPLSWWSSPRIRILRPCSWPSSPLPTPLWTRPRNSCPS